MCVSSKPYYQALPAALKPLHYDLSIDNITETSYEGNVKILLSVVEPTDELHLHYRDLTIRTTSVRLLGASTESTESSESTKIGATVGRMDPKKEVFVIKFDQILTQIGQKIEAEISFEGIIQTNMSGFYKSKYIEDGVSKYMLSTQFEATDARRAFPCLDEPALKATFTVHLTTSREMTVLGNMPLESVSETPTSKKVTFCKTPLMSTYLLAWAVGDFEYIQGFTEDLYFDNKPLPVSIYTTKGYTKEAQFALEIAPKIVDLFSKVFQVKYPLPKLDLIAVHSFSHNAMENWGLITYRSTALLYSPEKSAPSYKQNVAYVVAHEIAHQWFGNLVTMQWWDELWLNEGFATWVGYYAVDYLFPEWDIFSEFVSSSLQQALRLDGLRNSHPIKVPVIDALDIDQLFDAISYLKGSSAILMLSTYLGTDVFLNGVAKYLIKHQFGNTTAENLWAAIAEVSGRDVEAMMEPWISKIGYPVINVLKSENGTGLQLTQSRFLNGGGVLPEEDKTLWWVPLNIKSSSKNISLEIFSEKKAHIDMSPSGLFKLNKDTQAPYRVSYDSEILNENILKNFTEFSTKDKVGIIADIISLATSGEGQTSTITFLELVKSVALNADLLQDAFAPWKELVAALSSFSSTFSGSNPALSDKIHSFCKAVYAKLAIKLLEENIPASDYSKSKLKSLVLKNALGYRIPKLETYAESAFSEWTSSSSVDSSLREFIFGAVASSKSFNKAQFDSMVEEVKNPSTLDSRELTLSALGNVRDRSLASELLLLILDENVIPTMDAHFLAVNLTKNSTIRDDFWEFFKSKYDTLHKLMSTNMVVLDRFVKLTLCNYQSMHMFNEVEQFFENKDVHGFERALNQVLDQIHINAAWYERDNAQVYKWLESNGF